MSRPSAPLPQSFLRTLAVTALVAIVVHSLAPAAYAAAARPPAPSEKKQANASPVHAGKAHGTPQSQPDRAVQLNPGAQLPVAAKKQEKTVPVPQPTPALLSLVASHAAPNPVQPGSQARFAFAWKILQTEGAGNLTLSTVLPDTVDFRAAGHTGAFNPADRTVRWNVGKQMRGAAGNTWVDLAIRPSLDNGTDITLVGRLEKSGTVYVEAKDALVITAAARPELTVTPSSAKAEAGTDLTYTIAWKNSGTAPLHHAILEFQADPNTVIPRAFALDQASDPNAVRWNLGDLAAGDQGTANVTVGVNQPLRNGTALLHSATLSGLAPDSQVSAAANGSVAVKSKFSLAAAGDAAPEQAAPGNLVTYDLTWSALGTAPVEHASFVLKLDPNLTPVSASGSAELQGNVVQWPYGTVEPDGKESEHRETVVARVSPNASGETTLNSVGQVCGSDAAGVPSCASVELTTLVADGPALGVSLTPSVSAVRPGAPLTYTIDWSVGGTGIAEDVTLVASVPEFINFGTILSNGTYHPASHAITWQLGDQAAGNAGQVTWSASVDTPLLNGTTLESTATLSAAGLPASADTADVQVTSRATLHLANTAGQENAAPGEEVQFNLAWSIMGDSPAERVILTDSLPEELAFVKATGHGTYDPLTRTVTWTLGDRNPGEDGAVTLTVRSSADLPLGTKTVTVGALTAENAGTVRDDAAAVLDGAPELAVRLQARNKQTVPGATIAFDLVVTNTGTARANNVQVVSKLPSGLIHSANGLRTREYRIGDLKAGAVRKLSFNASLRTDLNAGTYLSTAEAQADNAAAVSDPASLTVFRRTTVATTGQPVMQASLTVDRASAQVGAVLTYTLTVKNVGPAAAHNVRVSDTLPAGLAFIDRTGSATAWAIGDLLPNHRRVLQFQARVAVTAAAGAVTNAAVIDAENHPTLRVEAKTTLQRGQVLGALATTGPSLADAVLALIGLSSLSIGLGLVRRRRFLEA